MGLQVDERQLIQQLIAGQAAVWDEFVSTYQHRLVICIRQTALHCQYELDAAEIEDVCADIFAGLIANDFRSLRNFRGQCRISTWLTVIARRACLNRLSQMRRGRETMKQHAECLGQSQALHLDALSRMICDEQHESIRSSVKRLNDKDRQLLELYFQKQLSYAEIGKRTGISTNSVGPKLGRAIVRLRRILRHA